MDSITSATAFHTRLPADYIARLDWNVTSNGKHTLFWRGNLQNDREPTAPVFPGQPPQTVALTNSKGFAVGYTFLITSNLVNDVAVRIDAPGCGHGRRLQRADHLLLRGCPAGFESRSTSFIIPVQNLTDNLSWTKHDHNFAFGGNVRFIDDQRTGNAQSYPDGQMNQGWLTRSSTIANSHGPFDPQDMDIPPSILRIMAMSTTMPCMNLVGTITEGDAVYNYTKSGSTLAMALR